MARIAEKLVPRLEKLAVGGEYPLNFHFPPFISPLSCFFLRLGDNRVYWESLHNARYMGPPQKVSKSEKINKHDHMIHYHFDALLLF